MNDKCTFNDHMNKKKLQNFQDDIKFTPSPTFRSFGRIINNNISNGNHHNNYHSSSSSRFHIHSLMSSNNLPSGICDIDNKYAKTNPNYDATYARVIDHARHNREHLCIINNPENIFNDGEKLKKFFQPHLTLKQRNTTIDWIIELASSELDMSSSSIFLAVQILDIMSSILPMDGQEFALVGMVSLLLAGKIEEICPPSPDLLVKLVASAYSVDDIVRTEQTIVENLSFELLLPTRNLFLPRILLAAEMKGREIILANFIMEISLQDYMLNQYPPGQIAAASVHLARQMLISPNDQIWTPSLVYYSSYNEHELVLITKRLRSVYWRVVISKEDRPPTYCRYDIPEQLHVASACQALRSQDLRYDQDYNHLKI